MNAVFVFAGGGLGCLTRYFIGQYFSRQSLTLPIATFVSNISACLIFALVVWLAENKLTISPPLRFLLLTGFCGGLSTFSAFGFETYHLLRQQQLGFALLNIAGSVTLCTFIFYLFKI